MLKQKCRSRGEVQELASPHPRPVHSSPQQALHGSREQQLCSRARILLPHDSSKVTQTLCIFIYFLILKIFFLLSKFYFCNKKIEFHKEIKDSVLKFQHLVFQDTFIPLRDNLQFLHLNLIPLGRNFQPFLRLKSTVSGVDFPLLNCFGSSFSYVGICIYNCKYQRLVLKQCTLVFGIQVEDSRESLHLQRS